MAARWTCDHIVAEYRDLQANCMALDCTGQYAVLAGRRSVALIQLDQPSVPLKKVVRQSKWEVTAGEWSPHRQELFALASNQRAEVLCWRDDELTHHQMLRAHTRAISDLNWSSFDSNVLATASIDAFVYIWDIRDARKPAISLSAAAGASQVKWNKVSENILATCHEGDLRLWDPRQTTTPIQYVTAHLAKIYGLDWSPTQEHQLATSSQDCSVKFWNITNPRRVEGVLTCLSPVWRARYTPFGDGLVTVVVPRLHRGENSLVLWNLTNMTNLSTPVHTFVGHSDVVVEFAWRRKRDDSKDYELVTWSKDQSLRIWMIDLSLQRLCGHEAYLENDEIDLVTSSVQGNSSQDITDVTSVASQTSPRETEAGGQSTPPQTPYKSPDKNKPASSSPPSQPQNLQREFSLVNMNIPNITIKEMDITNRTCTVTAKNGKHVVCLKITFPNSYPNNSSPTFHFCKATNVDSDVKAKLLKVVRMVSQQQVKRNRSCLEPCLRQLITTLEACTEDDSEQDSDSPFILDPAKQQFIPLPMYGSLQDVSVPFPRTSGARFCGADFLVCFVRPPHLQRANVPTESAPRSLSALSAYLSTHLLPLKGRQTQSAGQYALVYQPVAQSPTGDSGVSISSFYRHDRKQKLQGSRFVEGEKRRSANQKSTSNCGAVLVYSISGLIPVNHFLAENYVLGDHNLPALCKRNANLAAEVGRKDLLQIWSLCALITCPSLKPSLDPDDGRPWAQHPFARQMIQQIIDHYVSRHDVQTVAMLCCIFGKKNDDGQRNKKAICEGSSGSQHSGKWWLKPGGSPYHTVVPADTQCDGWNLVGALKRNRSNSWSDSLEECRFFDCIPDPKELERETHEANIQLLDPKMLTKYDQFKKAYAEILYQWSLLTQRAQILKYATIVPEKHKGVEFLTECQVCHTDARGVQCLHCKNYSLNCSVCHIAVRGAANYCLACGHGGHALHMMNWFAERTSCPAGCGCLCLEENDIFG